jgi:hypothetical protein
MMYMLCPSLLVLGIKHVKGRPQSLSASNVATMDDDVEEGEDNRYPTTELLGEPDHQCSPAKKVLSFPSSDVL